MECQSKKHKKFCEKLSKEKFHFSHLSYGACPEAMGIDPDYFRNFSNPKHVLEHSIVVLDGAMKHNYTHCVRCIIPSA